MHIHQLTTTFCESFSPAVDFAGEATSGDYRAERHSGVWSSDEPYPSPSPGETDKSGICGSGRSDSGSPIVHGHGQEEGSAGGVAKTSRRLPG